MPNLSFRGQRELSTGLQLQQKNHNHTAISHCCLTRSQVGGKGAVVPPILDCKYLNVEKKLSRPRKTNYSTHQAVHSFAKVSALGVRGERKTWTKFKKFRKNFPICLGKLLEQNHRPAKLSYSFSSK